MDAHLGPAALVEWLRHRIDEAAADVGLERSRRLDSDAAAVQVITVHRSKGLEFPVVYVPFGWDRYVPREPDVPLLHDDADARVLDVGGAGGPRWSEHCARHEAEEAGEDLRLLYVALTRARCQVVTWWVPATTAPTSPLHRLLFGRRGPGRDPARVVPGAERRGRDDGTARAGGRGPRGGAGVRPAAGDLRTGCGATGRTRRGDVQPHAGPGLAADVLQRPDGRRTRRHAGASGGRAGGPGEGRRGPGSGRRGPNGPIVLDAVMTGGTAVTAVADPGLAVPSPMADLPVGTGFGTLVHAVFESADLTAPDLRAELLRCVHLELDRHATPTVDPDALAEALVPVARTPLGPLADGRSLADVAPRDRLAELDFELPLAGGDTPGADVRLGDLVPLLRRHLPAGDLLAGYPDRLAALAGQPLRGYLTGSMDAVLRLAGPRFAVVDYKTNWLGPIGPDGPEPLVAAHYTPERLATAMLDAHYPLQALLYAAALHRFLRWRLRDYDPGRHLGGVLYLFLRGMCGPDGPVVDGVPCGVFSWQPPAALVTELSDLLDRGAP